MRRACVCFWGLVLAVWAEEARAVHQGPDHTTVPLVIDEDTAYAKIERIGSGPGKRNVRLRVDMDTALWSLEEYPFSFSNTSIICEYDDATTTPTPATTPPPTPTTTTTDGAGESSDEPFLEFPRQTYRDTVYFSDTMAVYVRAWHICIARAHGLRLRRHHFIHDTDSRNVMGLHKDSDLFKQWTWMEICPSQQRLVLHAGTSNPADVNEHVCGYGAKVEHEYSECNHPASCDGNTFVYFSSKTVNSVQQMMALRMEKRERVSGTTGSQTSQPDIHVDDAGLYSVWDGQSLRLYPEFRAVHTHSWQAFLIIEVQCASLHVWPLCIAQRTCLFSRFNRKPRCIVTLIRAFLAVGIVQVHLIFFLHFVSDRSKSMQSYWTRIPASYGSLVAVCSAWFVYKFMETERRLYHRSTSYRDDGIPADIFNTLLFVATAFSACAVQVSFCSSGVRAAVGL